MKVYVCYTVQYDYDSSNDTKTIRHVFADEVKAVEWSDVVDPTTAGYRDYDVYEVE